MSDFEKIVTTSKYPKCYLCIFRDKLMCKEQNRKKCEPKDNNGFYAYYIKK